MKDKIKCILLFIVVICLVFYAFPGSMWFFEYWSALAIFYLLLSIFLLIEQLKIARPTTEPEASIEFSKRFRLWMCVFGGIIATSVALLFIFRMMTVNHNEKIFLSNLDIEKVHIQRGNLKTLTDEHMDMAKLLFQDSEVTYPNKQTYINRFTIILEHSNETITYRAAIQNNQNHDVVLTIPNKPTSTLIRIPSLGKLLIEHQYIGS